jgi:hypothetical protein
MAVRDRFGAQPVSTGRRAFSQPAMPSGMTYAFA